MATSKKSFQPVQTLGIKSIGEIPQYRFVNYNGGLCTSEQRAFGISSENWNSGELISVICLGIALIETAEPISIGDNLTSNSEGKAIIANTNSAVNARALESCSSPDIIRVKVIP